ncbi:MAG: hypothetical protein Q4B40_01075 [Clostridia bacterium]|nr:hypothetical protein [Clostridia bacterium]
MKNLLNKGKVIVSCVSVLAILAVSLLSVFTGGAFVSSAADDSTVTYPINGSYDADAVIKNEGVTYTDIDTASKTEVSNFTSFDTTFWLTADGDGTAANPFIVKTANQFAAVATNNLVYDAAVNPDFNISNYTLITLTTGKVLDTAGVYFKIADNVKAFNMNNTVSTVDFSGDMTANEVKTALETATVKTGLTWQRIDDAAPFKGIFDGNGAVIYGLKSETVVDAGVFPLVSGITVRNLTVKNCYFKGDKGSVLVGRNISAGAVTVQSCSIYNNYVLSTRLNEGTFSGGIILGSISDDAPININDSLICDNIARHVENVDKHNNVYDINYGLFTKAGAKDGAIISNTIVTANAPYSIIHNYNTFYSSQYNTVYTDMLDCTITNTDWKSDGGNKYVLTSTLTGNPDGTYTHTFTTSNNGTPDANYKRDYAAGSFFKVDAAAVKGADVKTAMPKIDWGKWTVNDNGYPVPKLYNVREYSAGSAWTGDVALFYAGGGGTAASPYVVSTAEEFALMLTTAKAGEYFTLNSDIILNDTSVNNWTDNAKQWFTSNDVPAFEGVLDGKGYSVSGLYYSGDQAGKSAGLIPVLGSGATIKNLTVKDSELNGKSDMTLGAISGSTADMCAKVINISSVVIEDTVKFNDAPTVGGIVAAIGYSAVNISDSISKSSGLFNSVTGQANVKRCVSVGAYPFAISDFVKAENVYTDTEGLTVDGVTLLANADMKGDAAATNMPALGFPTSWSVIAGDYPVPTGVPASPNGVKGEVWTGGIATGFAGGDGSEANPWLIETAEQLALCVSDTKPGKHYKLTADIYLNDVYGNLWKDKVGCIEWFTQRTVKNYNGTQNMTFDGGGYVVHGIYLNNSTLTDPKNEYYRSGLFQTLREGAHIKIVGISNAFIMGNDEFDDAMGFIVGNMGSWPFGKDNSGNYLYPEIVDLIIENVGGQEVWERDFLNSWGASMPTHDSNATKKILSDPRVQELVPVIENCFVDHNSYIKAKRAGGIIGYASGPITIKNCVVTASINPVATSSDVGAFIGNDAGYSSVFDSSLALTQTCTIPAMGVSHSDWRSTPEFRCSQAINTYYFAIQRTSNIDFIKIAKPTDLVGNAAKEFMKGLDWAGDDEDGLDDIWTVIPDGTPLQTIFTKNHTPEQYERYSNKNFTAPDVTVTFSTDTDDIDLEPITGAMYDKMSLPEISRQGYEFTGWYVFDDLSVKYPYDYFPPRDLTLFAGWKALGVIQTFEEYTDTFWDIDKTSWNLNRPGATGGYNNSYVRTGSNSMHLLDTNTTATDCLLNYEDMLVPGAPYTITFWVATDKADNPATLISLVHNSKPDYLNTGIAIENMAVVTGLKVGEWTQYSYSFTAKTNWVSLRASGGSSLYFDDIIMASLDGTLSDGTVSYLGNYTLNNDGILSPQTGATVSVAVLISAIVACAVIAIVSRKNLSETIEQ